MRRLSLKLSIFSLLLVISQSSKSNEKFKIDGKVLELDESNFDSAISSFDFIFVDFYAPWCGHCKRLSPELDAAAPVLAELKDPIVIAKVNADKYTRLASKYDVDGYPTLKVFMHGVPVDYYGPRKADLLVRYLKKFVAPDVAVLSSDLAIRDFVEAAGTNFPIFIGFDMNETLISTLGKKYKKNAWFSIANGFSEEIMVQYDFDKVPALVSLLPSYNEQSIFYGPFEGGTGMTYGKMKSQAGEPNWEVRERTTQHWKLQETSSKQNLSPKTLILINGSDLLWQDPVPTSPTVEHINATKTAAP